jgi:type II secretory pathway component GspD/PulD (secretin)
VITLGVVALARMAPGLERPLCTWYDAAEGDSLAVREVSCDADNVELQRLVNEFSDTLGQSFVLSGNASMMVVTARIQRQPWDSALELLFSNNALVAEEDERGNVSVLAQYEITDREAIEPLLTLAYQIRYREASEVADALRPFTSDRGTIAVDSLTGVMTVQDVSRVVNVVSELLSELDRPPEP